ncbi:hypothetical protein Tco_1468255 [Tanacetum coccineum]
MIFPAEKANNLLFDSPLLPRSTPGYVTESDPEEDPEEYEDDETEDGPVDYPMDGGDDGDDDDVFPPKGTKFPTFQSLSTERQRLRRLLAMTYTSPHLPISLSPDPPEAEVERLLAMTTPSPSPHISLSPPSVGERLARCTAPPAHLLPPSPGCPTQVQTLRITSTQTLIDVVTTTLPSPSLPPLPLSLYIPPPIDHRDEIPDSKQPPRKRLCLSTLGSRYEGIRDVGYGTRDTWVDPAEAVLEIALVTLGEVNTRVTELAELHEHDTQDLYALLEDAQDSMSRISQRVDMDSQQVDLLMGDRITLQEIVWMVEEEAYVSQKAWAHSIGLSQATHQELQTHCDHVRQDQMVETLRVIRDMRREMSDMQAELLSLREQQRRARQPGPEARIPDHQDASGDADSHI